MILNHNNPSICISVNMWPIQIPFFINHIFGREGRTKLRGFYNFSVCYKETPCILGFSIARKQTRSNYDNSLVSHLLPKSGVSFKDYQSAFTGKMLF